MHHAIATHVSLPLGPLDGRKCNFGALLNGIVLAICICLGSWKSVYDVQYTLHVVPAAACIVPDVSLYSRWQLILGLLAA